LIRQREAALPLSDARDVLLRVLLDGVPVYGALEAEVSTTGRRAAGWFHVRLALGADTGLTAAVLSGIGDATVEVQIGLRPAGSGGAWTSLITGPLDQITLDPIQGTAQLTGRDFSALFIDSLTAETFANRTSSEIVATLAVRRGLQAQVTPTQTPVGRYYQLGHDTSSLHQSSAVVTEWDLLQRLALAEGFELMVTGTTLVFSPPVASLVPIVWQASPGNSDLLDLQLERSLSLARDIAVTVQSWNAKQARMITQTVRASASGATSSSATPGLHTTNYVLVRPNMTPDQAQALAVQTLADLSRHERVALATMPGELVLAPGSSVLLTGTGTAFDQLYVVDEIQRRVSARDGFTQTVRAVNAPAMTIGSAAA
jgi:phage protein D